MKRAAKTTSEEYEEKNFKRCFLLVRIREERSGTVTVTENGNVYDRGFYLGDHREGAIPEPIPNSEVKPFIADGTTHKSVEE